MLGLLAGAAAYAAENTAEQAGLLLDQQRWGEAATAYEQLAGATPEKSEVWYALARARARIGDTDGAMAALRTAIDRGWEDRRRLEQEDDLLALRSHSDFPALAHLITAGQRQRASAALTRLQRKHGDGLNYTIDDEERLVFAVALDERSYAELRERLRAQSDALRELFTLPPQRYLTVVIPRRWANPRVTGHFHPPGFLDAQTMGATLRHEFTHALHFADQEARGQTHPVWMMEGLAKLYEHARFADGSATFAFGVDLFGLQAEVAAGRVHSFARLLALEQRQFTSQHYGQAGAMFMQLQKAGLLQRFYRTYVADQRRDPSGRAAYEATWSASLERIQEEWVRWVLAQPVPVPVPTAGSGRPSLGCLFTQRPDGLEISRLADEGPAAQAGLLVGDVVVAAAGRRIIDHQEVIPAVFGRRIGDTLPLTVRRATGDHTVVVTIARGAEPIAPAQEPDEP
jgi:tetratricopeptide (TPR) repeat protein